MMGFEESSSLSAEKLVEFATAALERVIASDVLLVDKDVRHSALFSWAVGAVQEVLDSWPVLPGIKLEDCDVVGIGVLFKEFFGRSAVRAVRLGEDDNFVLRNSVLYKSFHGRHGGCG